MGTLKKIVFLKSLVIVLTALTLNFQVNVVHGAAQKKSIIKGMPPANVNVNTAYSFVPQVKVKKSELKRLRFSIANKPAWANFNFKTGALTGTPTLPHIGTAPNIVIGVNAGKGIKGKLVFSISVVYSNQSVAPSTPTPDITVTEPTQTPPAPPTPTLSALMDEALNTGDANKLSTENLLNAGNSQAQVETDNCKTELAKIYPNNLEQSNFPIRSAYMSSSSSRNIPLHVADNDGSIEVYSWLGKKANGTPYAVLGTNVFSFTNLNNQNNPLNKSLKNSTLNVFRWLLKQDTNTDILSQPLKVVIPNSFDRSELAAWFSANGLTHNCTITGDTILLDIGNYDLYIADVRRNLNLVQKAFAANKPVLVYNNWYEPPADVLAEFDLVWSWYGEQTIGNLPSTTEQCLQASASAQIQTLMANLQQGLPDYNYSNANCPSNVGTVSCATAQLLDGQGKSAETAFFQGARSIRDQLNALDAAGKNVFALDDGSRC